MKVTTNTFGSGVNVLSNEHFVSIPYTVDFSKITEKADNGLKVIKAGNAMAAAGIKATTTPGASGAAGTSDAVGILMHDVYEDNPNTALIIHGFINTKLAESNMGSTYDEETKAALPMVSFL